MQNGVDTERVDTVLNGKKNRQDGRVRFIYVARIIPLKNHDFLLDVIKVFSTIAIFTLVHDSSEIAPLRYSL